MTIKHCDECPIKKFCATTRDRPKDMTPEKCPLYHQVVTGEAPNVSNKLVELPSEDEITEWIAKTFSYLNPDIRDYFYLGIEALYVKLGGNKFITVIMPNRKQATVSRPPDTVRSEH